MNGDPSSAPEARTEDQQASVLTYAQKLAACARAGHYITDMECWQCGGEGFSDHDCGEDVCCCLHPEDNVTCDICEGEGGWKVCLTCNPEAGDDGY